MSSKVEKVDKRNRPRLGRGLSSLISISEIPVHVELPGQPTETAGGATDRASAGGADGGAPSPHSPGQGGIENIPVSAITPNPHQPRQSFDEAGLADLAASIKSTGLIQPIIVRKVGSDYQLIAGERRLRAAKIAGLIHIPALIRDVDAITQAQMALIENVQREDLNPLDRAAGYRTLIDQLGLTQEELAGRMGEDRSSISNFLRLLELAEPVKAMVRDGRLSLGHAKLIAGTADILEQERLANLVLLQGLSVRNLERVIQEGPRPATRKGDPAPSPHIADLEKNIARQLGLRVQVKSSAKKGKGKLVIFYSNLDQFDELLGRLGVRTE